MPAICSLCHHLADRYTKRRDPTPAAASARPAAWLVTCHACSKPRHAGPSCLNPFSDLTLTHARDELDQPIHVSSLRQLRQAEKRYSFRSVVANSDEANFDKPPVSATPSLFDQMTESVGWLHPEIAQSMLEEMKGSGELD